MQDSLEKKIENNHVDFSEVSGPGEEAAMGTGRLQIQERPAGTLTEAPYARRTHKPEVGSATKADNTPDGLKNVRGLLSGEQHTHTATVDHETSRHQQDEILDEVLSKGELTSEERDRLQATLTPASEILQQDSSPSAPAEPGEETHHRPNNEVESLADHYFTSKELLQLVTQAEADRANQLAEVFNGKAYNVVRKGLGGESRRGKHVLQKQEAISGEQPAMDAPAVLASYALDEIEFTEGLKAIEYELLDLDEKAKNGDEKAKEELGFKMLEQWKVLDKLFDTQIRQGRNSDQGEQAIAGVVQRLTSPITNSLLKVWDKLNTPNPISPALSTLQKTVRMKADETRKPGVLGKAKSSLRNYSNYFRNPAALAEKITSLQATSSLAEKDRVLVA